VTILDASAFLAYVRAEPGGERIRDLIGTSLGISMVNYAEVLTRLSDFGLDPRTTDAEMRREGLVGQSIELLPLTEDDAVEVAALRSLTRRLGLSLGDRVCLVTGRKRGQAVLTADRAWSGLEMGVEIELIRP
jgi:ribonuclease VapC